MTDNEIIKALECCSNESESCVNCPLWKFDKCVNRLQKSALDLVNRQKAEIERLKKARDGLYEEMSERQKEEVKIARRIGKFEAYKELGEKIKAYAGTVDDYWFEMEIVDFHRVIDDMVKELEGDQK